MIDVACRSRLRGEKTVTKVEIGRLVIVTSRSFCQYLPKFLTHYSQSSFVHPAAPTRDAPPRSSCHSSPTPRLLQPSETSSVSPPYPLHQVQPHHLQPSVCARSFPPSYTLKHLAQFFIARHAFEAPRWTAWTHDFVPHIGVYALADLPDPVFLKASDGNG